MKNCRAFFSVFSLILTLAAPLAASAAIPDGVTYTIEPIVGYELQRRTDPDRIERSLVYGARVIAGYRLLSAEAEYTRGNSDETYGSPETKIEETTEKVRAGLRSTYDLGSFLSATLRGGAEMGKRNTKRTTSGVTTETKSPSKVDPYLGAGVGIHFGPQFSLTAEAVATVKDTKDLKKNEYTTTLGVKVNFNTR